MTVRDIFMVNEAGGTPPVASSYWAENISAAPNTLTFSNSNGGLITDINKNIYIYGVGSNPAVLNSAMGSLIKADEDGNLIYNTNYNYKRVSGSTVTGASVAINSSDEVYCLAAYSEGSILNSRFLLYKTDSSGVPTIIKYYTTGNSPRHVFIDSSNNIYVVGYCGNASILYRPVISKLDSSGNTVWAKNYGTFLSGPFNLRVFNEVSTDSLGYIYCCGGADGGAALVKYDSSGNIIWEKAISAIPVFTGIAIDSSNNIYCCGSYIASGSYTSGIIVKYDSSGNLLWQRILTNPYRSLSFEDIVTDSLGNVYCAGLVDTASGVNKGCIVKYDSSGTFQWERHSQYNSTRIDFYNIEISANGAVVVLGRATTTPNSIVVLQVPPDGSLTGTYANFTYLNGNSVPAISTVTDASPAYANTNVTFSPTTPPLSSVALTLTTTKNIF